jgi:hypothetical protein
MFSASSSGKSTIGVSSLFTLCNASVVDSSYENKVPLFKYDSFLREELGPGGKD